MALFHLLKVKARFYHIGKSRVNQKHASRIYCRNFAIVPSSSLDVHTTGRCTLVPDQSVPRKIPLASSIRLRNSSVSELRQEFINFFHNHQHSIVAPASIFPKRHEGSYFVNAGMNQFKSIFLNQSDSICSEFKQLRRATNSQPCIRVGGRYDDLNDVGYDRHHHTMFEMLGSWSFGDYYKEEACSLIWKFLTEVLNLPVNSIYITYFGGDQKIGIPPDDETRNIWLKLGVMDQKLMPFGIESNFWRASRTSGGGLCGPSTEVHIDFKALSVGDKLDCARCLVNTSSPQVVELWNCVFITHRFIADSNSTEDILKPGLLQPLAKSFVDTGMGLERLACVMQGITSNYDSYEFISLMEFIRSKANSSGHSVVPTYQGLFLSNHHQENAHQKVERDHSETALSSLWHKISGMSSSTALCSQSHLALDHSWKDNISNDLVDVWHRDTAYRILVDHSRAIAFGLADGLLPGRQGLPLKIRHLIQRAFRASVLTGLEVDVTDCHKLKSLLGALVSEVAKQEVSGLRSFFDSMNIIRGPSCNNSESLTPEQMESVINKEVNWFAPRLMEMEESFNRCLEECTGETRLSADQVTKLMNGKYGSHLSWDMICAQSRWAGLLPPLPVEPKPQSDQTNSSTVKRYKSNVNTISHQLHNSRVPYTNDSLKYNYYRKSDSVENQSDLYDFPDCETKLLGVLVLTSKGNEYELIVKQPSLNSKLFSTVGILSGKAKNACPSDVIGLIFEQTNFFASCGGQDSDTGLIYYHSKGLQFQVDETTFLPDSTSNSSTNGWVIHWCQKLNTSPGSMSDIQFDQPFILSIDKERRYNLMCAHTGQHLFTSALESLMQSDSSKLSTFQHFGGVTHPNHFTLKAAVVGPVSDQMQEDLADFIQQLEQRCQQLINKDIPISIWNTDVTKATKMKEIRYFPWEEYGEKVRAVCIGKVEHSFGDNEAADFTSVISAELCGGTHLSKLCDLQDIAVIAVKGRQKTVKEFTCIFGQSAKNAHQYGNALVKEGKLREKQAIENPEEANIHVKWLESVLNDPLSTGLLPLYARLALEAYVYRIKNKTDDNPIDEDRVQLYVQSLETMMRNKCETSHTAIAKLDFDKSDELILAFLRLSTTQPFVVYHENLAVCYFPRLNSNETALNCAHMVAKCLSTELNKVHLTAKGRPIRSTHLNGLERYKYAFLKLLPISEMITNCTNSEISHLHWESYHTLLSDCVNSVLINSES